MDSARLNFTAPESWPKNSHELNIAIAKCAKCGMLFLASLSQYEVDAVTASAHKYGLTKDYDDERDLAHKIGLFAMAAGDISQRKPGVDHERISREAAAAVRDFLSFADSRLTTADKESLAQLGYPWGLFFARQPDSVPYADAVVLEPIRDEEKPKPADIGVKVDSGPTGSKASKSDGEEKKPCAEIPNHQCSEAGRGDGTPPPIPPSGPRVWPSHSSLPSDCPKPNGIGGMLWFFCFITIVVTPAACIAGIGNVSRELDMIARHAIVLPQSIYTHFTIARISLFLLGGFSLLAGYCIYTGSPAGRSWALAIIIFNQVVNFLIFLSPPTNQLSGWMARRIQNESSRGFGGALFWGLFWFFYFLLSRRVSNTYDHRYAYGPFKVAKSSPGGCFLIGWSFLVSIALVFSLISILAKPSSSAPAPEVMPAHHVTSRLEASDKPALPTEPAFSGKSTPSIKPIPSTKPSPPIKSAVPGSKTVIDPPHLMTEPAYTLRVGKLDLSVPVPRGAKRLDGLELPPELGVKLSLGWEDGAERLFLYQVAEVMDVDPTGWDKEAFASLRKHIKAVISDQVRSFHSSVDPSHQIGAIELIEEQDDTMTMLTRGTIPSDQGTLHSNTFESFVVVNETLVLFVVVAGSSQPIDSAYGQREMREWLSMIRKSNKQPAPPQTVSGSANSSAQQRKRQMPLDAAMGQGANPLFKKSLAESPTAASAIDSRKCAPAKRPFDSGALMNELVTVD